MTGGCSVCVFLLLLTIEWTIVITGDGNVVCVLLMTVQWCVFVADDRTVDEREDEWLQCFVCDLLLDTLQWTSVTIGGCSVFVVDDPTVGKCDDGWL